VIVNEFNVIIPARYASSRLPGKPLLDIAGKPMVVRVAQRTMESGARKVIIATDHEAIARAAQEHGIEVCITGAHHVSGTDRLAEVVDKLDLEDDEVVVNVQGDEPLIDPKTIRNTALQLHLHPEAAIATVCHAIHDKETLFNPNVVKVVVDVQGFALYFSRAPIPYARDAFGAGLTLPEGLPAYRHIGLYAYRAGYLRYYANLSQAPIEQFEALEQLRALWHGYKICVAVSDQPAPPGVDTAEDLERVRRMFEEQIGQ
jgi:3-deoxy-manno-octulosonate cytidylyltransferase (CMP-KDO synthetase)